MKEFLGIGYWSWSSIALNAGFIGMNYAFLSTASNSLFSAAAIGWHAAIILSAVFVDRVFLAPMRQEIRELDARIAWYRDRLPPKPNNTPTT